MSGVEIGSEFQAGFEKLALNFNLPAAASVAPLPNRPATLDVKFLDAELWVGSLALAIDCPSGLSAVIKGQANAKRNIRVFEREEWAFAGDGGVTWTGSQLEWWALEGQIKYRPSADFAVLVGLRRDHLSVNLLDPIDSNGNPLNFDDSGTIPPFSTFTRHQRYYSDLLSKLWIPYVGLEIVGPNYRASLIGSPLVSAEMTIPAAFLFDLTIVVFGNPIELLLADSLRYHVNKPAIFLEGNLQYDCTVFSSLNVGLWCKGSWLSLRGGGSWTCDFWGQVINNGVPFAPSEELQSQHHNATYTRYVLGGGLFAEWPF